MISMSNRKVYSGHDTENINYRLPESFEVKDQDFFLLMFQAISSWNEFQMEKVDVFFCSEKWFFDDEKWRSVDDGKRT